MRMTLLAILGGSCLLAMGPFVPCGRALAEDDSRSAGAVRPWPEIDDSRGFDVDVLVGGRPLPESGGRGRHDVEAVEGADYELRIRNPLSDRVAVAVFVDGLNTIDARRDPARDASKWVIGPYQTITLSGWQMSSERARRFTFTTERDSYAAKLGRTADYGVISAVFFRERRPVAVITPHRAEADHPRSEGADSAEAPARSAGAERGLRLRDPGYSFRRDDDRAATGIGRSVAHEVRSVSLELESHPVAEVVIHYAYRPVLPQPGVLPRFSPEPDAPRRHERAHDSDDRRFSPEP